MKRILALFAVLVFAVSCGGSEGDSGVYGPPGSGPHSQNPPDEELRNEGFNFRDRNTWHLAKEACEEGVSLTGNSLLWEEEALICRVIQDSPNSPFILNPPEEGHIWRWCDSSPDYSAELEWWFGNMAFNGLRGTDEQNHRGWNLHIAEGATYEQRDALTLAVGYVNSALSTTGRYVWGPLENVTPLQGEPPAGSIYVDFTGRDSWVGVGAQPRSVRATTRLYPESAHAWVRPSQITANRTQTLALLAHELLHAIGFTNHVGSGVVVVALSIMKDNAPGTRSGILYPIDRAAIRYLTENPSNPTPSEEEIWQWLNNNGCPQIPLD